MGEKLVVGPFKKGLQNNVLPFLVDNDAFPTLINAYQWRGRIKRKRGTQLLNRLKRYFDSTSQSRYVPYRFHFKDPFAYGAITHYGRTFQSVPLKPMKLKG